MANEEEDKDLNLDEEDIDSENEDIDQDDDLKDIKVEDLDKLDDVEKLKEVAKKALTTKQKFYARVKDTSEKFKKYKQENPPKIDDPTKGKKIINKKDSTDDFAEDRKRIAKLELSEKKRQFGYENGLSPEETDHIFQITGNNPKKDDLEKPFIKGGLAAIRRDKRAKDNTPEPGTKFSAGGKTWEQMTPAEKKVHFPEYMKAKRGSKS